jgi:siroheme synthase-like protein
MSNLFPYFPVFLDLAGRSAVLLGGDSAMTRLARQCLDAGASVSVFDSKPSDALRALAPPLRLTLRRWRGADMQGASLVAAAESEPSAVRARAAAHAAGAVFYAFGAPEISDIALGAVTARGAWAVGIAAPKAPAALAEAVRQRLDNALPMALGACLAAGERARADVERRLTAPDARARFWQALADAAFDRDFESDAEWDAFVADLLDANAGKSGN